MKSEEVEAMTFMIVFLLLILGLSARGMWLAYQEADSREGRSRAAAGPKSIEGVLTAQLDSGEITSRQYVRSMEGVAEIDVWKAFTAASATSGSIVLVTATG